MHRLWSALIAALGLTLGCADGGSAGGSDGPCRGPTAPASSTTGATGFQLHDFQPQSCGYGQLYGLDRFLGRATLVALLAGW